MNGFKWRKVSDIPEDKDRQILLAYPNKTGDSWLYFLGFYIEANEVMTVLNNEKLKILKSGFYTFNTKMNTYLPLRNASYWTYIEEPSDILEDMVIADFY